MRFDAGQQEYQGKVLQLRNKNNIISHVWTGDMDLKAEEIDYDQNTNIATARRNVHFVNITHGEILDCDLAIYNLNDGSGTFYQVTGSSPSRIEAKPGLLTTSNPFYFKGEWAERLKDDGKQPHYILHEGFVTDCKPDNVWWKLYGSSFDIVPGNRAIAHHSWMYLKGVPIFYDPWFYKSLKKQDRRSGFLTPNIGNSSLRGQTAGVGYYWAINRSYDVTYRAQIYTQTGISQQADFRGIVNANTTFDASIFGSAEKTHSDCTGTGADRVCNKVVDLPGGYVVNFEGKSYLGKGWEARGELRELSSFQFRQSFTQSFDEAINSETHSIGFVTKHWNDYGFNFVTQRNVNYQTNKDGDQIVIRKLPEAQLDIREHKLGKLPIWFSMESSYGLERRTQPLFQTRQFVQRADLAPHIMTAFHWKGFNLAPSFAFRNTFYDSKMKDGKVVGDNLLRSARDVTVELNLPSLERIFAAPKWMRAGDQIKHVVETRVVYRYVTGINNFNSVPRFDEVDLMSNTHEVEFSLTNRILQRSGANSVSDLFIWQVWYKRYLDPTFGGAVQPGVRNVLQSTNDLTGYAFLNGPRNQSPIVNVLRVQSRVGVEWQLDYDPVRGQIVNSGFNINTHLSEFSANLGKYQVKTDPLLAVASDQLRGSISWGGDNHRGWNYGFSSVYDYKTGKLQYTQTQTTYNTDCCGFSLQYRRFNFAYGASPDGSALIRHDNQFRLAFAISNFASFGTLRKQDRIF